MEVHMQIYKVGGAVRDRLLGRPVSDIDWLVVGATVEQMLALAFARSVPISRCSCTPKTGEEYALARTERKSGRGYGGFTFHASPDVTLEEDLIRRDLTINAMDEQGTLTDPYHGKRDLNERILRHVSPAFAEDPCGYFVLPALLLATRPWVSLEETLGLMRQIAESANQGADRRAQLERDRACVDGTRATGVH
jgi:tRNA nucleotidyltransferase (CCA-adding enzyme)